MQQSLAGWGFEPVIFSLLMYDSDKMFQLELNSF